MNKQLSVDSYIKALDKYLEVKDDVRKAHEQHDGFSEIQHSVILKSYKRVREARENLTLSLLKLFNTEDYEDSKK